MPKLRVHNFAISLDGYGAGPGQDLDNPLGAGGEQLHEWAVATRSFGRVHGGEGGDEGLDDDFVAEGDVGIGATIMGRNMFGPIRGPWSGAADGSDVRLGGGAATIQQYLRAGLIDEMHVAIVPILLGGGERLFDHLDGGPEGYECTQLVSSPAVTHVRLTRTPG